MILGFIIGVGVAFLLTWFHIDHTVIAGVRELLKIDIGPNGYYLLMGIAGGISRVMIGGFISGLVVAYLFTFVKFDHIILGGLKEWFHYDISTSGYYLLFAILGAAMSFLKVVRMFLSPFFFLLGGKGGKSSRR
ncbi:Hypothetical protein LUCI_4490 [Lucifera butyrica]|uniref:Uncharacterized protein n=1 Tax=Lucifera butyrica TaxID=1351585 RepID=A0A498RGH8_9FIRM|nr:hypothetical protein [Lucifera butyrica]VBB09203.1 Hypothetical protein LUCI_4490 [Lucifera butyrica]